MSNGFDSMKCQKRLSFDCSIFHVGNMKQKKKSCWTLVLYFIFPLILKVEPPQAIKHKIWEIKITLFFLVCLILTSFITIVVLNFDKRSYSCASWTAYSWQPLRWIFFLIFFIVILFLFFYYLGSVVKRRKV